MKFIHSKQMSHILGRKGGSSHDVVGVLCHTSYIFVATWPTYGKLVAIYRKFGLN